MINNIPSFPTQRVYLNKNYTHTTLFKPTSLKPQSHNVLNA